MRDLIVIGGGPGGYEAAAHAARLGKKVTLIEKQCLGGTCLNVGCIPAKTFLRSSKLFHECQNLAYGVRVSSPQFDMVAVVERKKKIVSTLTRGVAGLLRRVGVETIQGTAKLVARNAVEVGDQRIEARSILIATGSRAAVPPIPGLLSDSVLDSNSIFDLTLIPEKVAIIGGGVIGLEFACFFSEIGSSVEVFEMLPKIAAGIDEEIGARLRATMERQGIKFHLSAKVLAVRGETVHYTSLNQTRADGEREDKARDETGDEETLSFAADCILNATGRSPVTDGIGLEDLAVDFNAKGIRTDDYGKTNISGIWACGDVTGRRMLAHAATREGIVAVNNMFGKKDRIRYNGIPSVIYTHPEVASVGKTEEELKALGIEYRKGTVPMAVAGRFLIENEGASGLVKVLTGAKYGEILGVHALGDGCSEFICAAAMMVETEMCATAAGEVVFPHPTVSEALRESILAVH
jgi:dihydrolipoamide dehydrogenase